MKLRDSVPLVAMLAFLAGCGQGDAGKPTPPAKPAEAAHDHVHGPHDGEVLELGEEEGHVELIHDGVGGNVTVYVFGKDLKTPVSVVAPTIVVQTKDGPKEFTLTAVGDASGGKAHAWKGSHAALVADPLNGRIRVNIGGKDFQSPLEPVGHDH